MTLTPEQRDGLRALAEAATPGPWSVRTKTFGATYGYKGYLGSLIPGVAEECASPTGVCDWEEDAPLSPEDAALIVAMRNALPALLDALDAAEAALASIMAREEEVSQDEGWQIGGAWGDYGEVVVPLRILSYVVGGELDQKIVSTDPGYAATYAEQVARAEAAEAARDTAERQVKAVRELHNADGFQWVGFPRADKRDMYCTRCHETAPCSTIRALDGEVGA